LYCSYESKANIVNSIIWDNIGFFQGAQVAVGSGDLPYPLISTVSVSYSDIGPSVDVNEFEGLGELDVVFAIDTTGSMGTPIDAVTNSMTQIISMIAMRARDYRIGIVGYRDHC